MLIPETRSLVGRLLEFTRYYGWGWFRADEGAPWLDYEDVLKAGPFNARLTSLWEWRDELRGGIARVEHDGHPYDKYWVVFWTMTAGTFPLDAQMKCQIDVQIGPDEPRFTNDWPKIESGVPRFGGHVGIQILT